MSCFTLNNKVYHKCIFNYFVMQICELSKPLPPLRHKYHFSHSAWTPPPQIGFKIIFLLNQSLGRFCLYVALSVCLSFCMSPLLSTGTERATDFWSNSVSQNKNLKIISFFFKVSIFFFFFFFCLGEPANYV